MSEELTVSEMLETITKMRAALMEKVPALTKERDDLTAKKNKLHEAVDEAQQKYDAEAQPIDKRLASIAVLLAEANVPELAKPSSAVVAVGGKKKLAMEFLKELPQGTSLRVKDVATAAGYSGGAAGAYTKSMVTAGYLTQPGGSGTAYIRTAKAIA